LRSALASLLTALLVYIPLTAAQDPYDFYGGEVEADRKNPAIEACEYEELVEKQRCNKSLNKSSCIPRVREECRERFGDEEPQTTEGSEDSRRERPQGE
jgi:hypothetical protein